MLLFLFATQVHHPCARKPQSNCHLHETRRRTPANATEPAIANIGEGARERGNQETRSLSRCPHREPGTAHPRRQHTPRHRGGSPVNDGRAATCSSPAPATVTRHNTQVTQRGARRERENACRWRRVPIMESDKGRSLRRSSNSCRSSGQLFKFASGSQELCSCP